MKRLPDLQSLSNRVTVLEKYFIEYRDMFCELLAVIHKITQDLNQLKKDHDDV
jgi:hypothetical protein